MGKITDIIGPFEGKINSIYHFKTENGPDFIFRARISKAFRYENIIKEKILFPFLDGQLSDNTADLNEKITEINNRKIGAHVITNKMLPVKIQNLYYYDETKKRIPFIFSISEFIPGESLYYPLERDRKNIPILMNSMKYRQVFYQLGKILGKLHLVKFDGFYSDIRDIGDQNKKKEWIELFGEQLNKEMNEAKTHHSIQPLLPRIEDFFKKYMPLVQDEKNPVLFHNDFQSQNVIVQEFEQEFEIRGIIDFDNWRIGPPAQDLVKIQYWTIQGDKCLEDAFFSGYLDIHKEIDRKSLQQRINIYKMLWFILVFNFEMDKVLKNEQNIAVDRRFPAAEKYLNEIEKVLVESNI